MKTLFKTLNEAIFDTDTEMHGVETEARLNKLFNLKNQKFAINGDTLDIQHDWLVVDITNEVLDELHNIEPKIKALTTNSMVQVLGVDRPETKLKTIKAERVIFKGCDGIKSGHFIGEYEVRFGDTDRVENAEIDTNEQVTFYSDYRNTGKHAHLVAKNLKIKNADEITVTGFKSQEISCKGPGVELVYIVVPQEKIETVVNDPALQEFIDTLYNGRFRKPVLRKAVTSIKKNHTLDGTDPAVAFGLTGISKLKTIKWQYSPKGFHITFFKTNGKQAPTYEYYNPEDDTPIGAGWVMRIPKVLYS